MEHNHDSISIGFTDQCFPPGVHVCQIYTDEAERQDSVLQFLLAGLQNEERTTCFSEKVHIKALQQLLEAEGIPFEQALQSGAVSLNGTRDVYFRDGTFNPEKMLEMLKNYYQGSQKLGFKNARVIGEMTADIEEVPGGERLLEYESRVSLLLKDHPVTAVCQYSAHDFSGSTIMNVLKVHPYMVVRGRVVSNPFYIPPEQFLA